MLVERRIKHTISSKCANARLSYKFLATQPPFSLVCQTFNLVLRPWVTRTALDVIWFALMMLLLKIFNLKGWFGSNSLSGRLYYVRKLKITTQPWRLLALENKLHQLFQIPNRALYRKGQWIKKGFLCTMPVEKWIDIVCFCLIGDHWVSEKLFTNSSSKQML